MLCRRGWWAWASQQDAVSAEGVVTATEQEWAKQHHRHCSLEVRTWKGMRAVTRQYRTIPTPHTSTGYRLQARL